MKKTAFFSIILFFLFSYSFAQFTIPEKPAFQTSVYDYANLLSSVDKSQLEEKLVRYSDSTTTQIVVITIESLKGEYIATLATNWAQTWGIGDAKKDNGVLILVAKTERKTWISPGYGVEDKLIAATCADITKTIINPQFKTGNFYGGLDKGADAIFKVLKGKFKGTRIDDTNDGGGIFPILFFVVIFLVIFFISRKNNGGNSGNNSGGGPSILDMIILSNLGRSSGGSFGGGGFGGGSSGGGFGGGFGGGGFSGGGGGGDW